MNQPATTFERRQTILRIVQERSGVKVTELAKLLNVSEGTIRNDLMALDKERRLVRVRGGAVAREQILDHPRVLAARARVDSDAERWIAKWAVGLIESGDVILLDASPIVLHMASYLQDRGNLTLVTNGIEVAQLLADNPSNTVILLGGILRRNGQALTGSIGEHMLRELRIRTAFVSCSGFSVESGFMETDIQEAELKRYMVQAAQRTVVLMDSDKLGNVGLTPFATIHEIDHLATNSGLPSDVIDQFREANTQVTVCGESAASTYTSYHSATQIFKIGFANLSEAMPFCRDVRRGLERAAQQTHQVDLIVADNQLDPQIALNVADDLIARAVDLAIEYQIDESAGNLIAHRFHQAGIPVIAVDIPMVGATFFGVDNYAVGHVAGVALGQAVEERWNGHYDLLVVLEHPRAGSLPAARIQGQIDGFRQVIEHFVEDDIIYLDSGNTTEISKNQMLALLKDVPDAQHFAVICFNDDAAIGALEAARQLDREENTLIVGQGADRRLRDVLRQPSSRIIGSTAFKPEQYGQKLVEIALKILDGQPVPPAVYMEHTFINAQNVDTYYPLAEDNH